MSKQTEEAVTCDHCGQEKRYRTGTYGGGHPLRGWCSLIVHAATQSLAADYCSRACLVAAQTRELEGRKK